MDNLLLTLHSLVRWVVVIAAVLAVGHAWWGWLGKRAWTPLADRLGMIFTISLDVQVLLGIVLYFFGPTMRAVFPDFGAAMQTAGLRFFAVEHVALMLVAVVIAHIGRARARRAEDSQTKYRRTALFFGAAVLLILVAIPWPFLGYGRPWLRLEL